MATIANFMKFWGKTAKNSGIFNETFEIGERCKGVHCVDFGESFLFETDSYTNAYFLAKFGFDTTENEPCKVCLLSAYRSLGLVMYSARLRSFLTVLSRLEKYIWSIWRMFSLRSDSIFHLGCMVENIFIVCLGGPQIVPRSCRHTRQGQIAVR